MTYDETKLWLRFMKSKATLKNFEYMYRLHRFDKRELEQYLEETDAEDVLISAFAFSGSGNTIFGYKYWKKLNEKWHAKLREYRETGHIVVEPPQVKCTHCKRLLTSSQFVTNQKGMLHKHCKECESGEWDRKKKEREQEEKELKKQEEERRKLECEESMKKSWLKSTRKVCSHCGKLKKKDEFSASDVTEDGLQSWCKDCQSEMESASNHVDNHEEKEDQKQSAAERMSAPKLGEYDATFHYASKKSITLNSILSELLLKGGFTKCYLKSDMSHRQFLIFNKIEGANIVNISSRSSLLVGFYSADICRTLAERFNLKLGETSYLHISKNTSRRDDLVTIEVIAVRSREEYVGIVNRREGKKPEQHDAPPSMVSKPAKVVEENKSEPLLDFTDIPMSAEERIGKLIDRNVLTEKDLAAFLYNKGWKLQEPVRSYKKFAL